MPEPASCDKTQQKLWLAKSDGVSMRSNRKMILISTIWCFLIPITGCLAQKSAPGTAVAFQLYLLQKDSLPIPKRISALNAILDKDDQFAQAHAELARLLVSTGGRKNRIEALVAIERAISLQPKNAEFHYLAGTIHLQRDLYSHRTTLARKAFKHALEFDPSSGETYYQLGLLAEQAYFETRYLAALHTDWRISFLPFAMKDVVKARRYFAESAKLLENPQNAQIRLALLAFDQQQQAEMADWLAKAIAADSTQYEPWLWLAYLHYQKGDARISGQLFAHALALMPDSVQDRMPSIQAILHPDQVHDWQKKSESLRRSTAHLYWRKHDPLYQTPLNERLLEHCVRVAYAQHRYASFGDKNDGSQSDQGKTLVRFGFPQSISGRLSKLYENDQSTSGSQPFITNSFNRLGQQVGRTKAGANSNERYRSGQLFWSYDSFAIPFDRLMSGRNEFARGVERSDGREIFNKVTRKSPTLFEMNWPGRHSDISLQLYQFKSDLANTELYAVAQFADSMARQQVSAACTYAFFVLDTLYQPVAQTLVKAKNLPMMASLQLPPGTYAYSSEFVDTLAQWMGVERGRLPIRSFESDRLQISDLVVSNRTMPGKNSKIAMIKGIAIQPAFTNHFRAGDQLTLLFEIYQLLLKNGASRYRIEISIGQDNIERIALSYDFQGTNSDILVVENIDLEGTTKGRLLLTVRITDLNSGQGVSCSRPMVIVE